MRVWRKGSGPLIGYFAGWRGLPRWTPFLDELAKHRTVVAPSLPGFPGGGRAHLDLDNHLDWIVATRRVFAAAGLEGADLVGSSVGGGLAAELAALWPIGPRRLVLIAPLGFYDEKEPPADMFARRADEYPAFLCANPDAWRTLTAAPPTGLPPPSTRSSKGNAASWIENSALTSLDPYRPRNGNPRGISARARSPKRGLNAADPNRRK